MITVYVSIGNSDDKLGQERWSDYVSEVDFWLGEFQTHRHGEWYSLPNVMWQNACWCIVVDPLDVDKAKAKLAELAAQYEQAAITWAEAQTSFIGAAGAETEAHSASDL